jgi:hypothetical protein
VMATSKPSNGGGLQRWGWTQGRRAHRGRTRGASGRENCGGEGESMMDLEGAHVDSCVEAEKKGRGRNGEGEGHPVGLVLRGKEEGGGSGPARVLERGA